MPDYEYEALDSSGKLVTGTSSHPNEAFARAKIEKLGLYPVRLTVIQSSIPKKKLRDRTFGMKLDTPTKLYAPPICGIVVSWIMLWVGFEDKRKIPNEIGLFQHYCFNCKEVVETRLSTNKTSLCIICGVPSTSTKFSSFVLLVGGGGLKICMVALLISRFRSSNPALSPPS